MPTQRHQQQLLIKPNASAVSCSGCCSCSDRGAWHGRVLLPLGLQHAQQQLKLACNLRRQSSTCLQGLNLTAHSMRPPQVLIRFICLPHSLYSRHNAHQTLRTNKLVDTLTLPGTHFPGCPPTLVLIHESFAHSSCWVVVMPFWHPACHEHTIQASTCEPCWQPLLQRAGADPVAFTCRIGQWAVQSNAALANPTRHPSHTSKQHLPLGVLQPIMPHTADIKAHSRATGIGPTSPAPQDTTI